MNSDSELLTLEQPTLLSKKVQKKSVDEPLTLEEIKRIRDIPINFIVGKERSGTTLLQLILNSHPSISAPPESRFIMLLYPRYGKITNWTEKDLINFCNDLFREKAFKTFWEYNRETLRESIIAAKEIATYPLLCKIVFYHFSSGKKVKLFFDKNPIHCYFLPQLKMLFPEAKYIHLIRDYRANIASHRRVFYVKKSPDISYKWLKMNQEVEKAKKLSPTNFFSVKYETLVKYPYESISQVCNFLNIPFYGKMISKYSQNIYSSYIRHDKPRFKNIHQRLFHPITPNFTDEWKKTLAEKDILFADKIAGEYAEKMYGYAKVYNTKSEQGNISREFLVKLKYRLIKHAYLVILGSPTLYFIITKHIWKNF